MRQNMKISKGMYVRYKYHNEQKIGKVDFIIYNEFADENFIGLTNNEGIFEGKILKANFNIIDLIEVGDYINGYPVVDILECYDNDTKRKINRIVYIDKAGFEIDNRLTIVGNNDIKDIITKEQFNSMKYVIERDN